MSLLSLIAKLGIDISQFKRGLVDAQSEAKKFGSEVDKHIKERLAEAFGVAAIIHAIEKTREYAKNIEDTGERLGVTTKALQEWNYAATQGGADLATVTGFFEKLAIAREKALGDSSGTEAAAFSKLGVGISDLQSKRLEDLGKQIGETVKAGDSQQLISALREVGGKSAGSLIPAFKDGIDEAADSARKLGIILDDEVIEKMDLLARRGEQMAAQWRGPIADSLLFFQKRLIQIGDLANVTIGPLAAYWGAKKGGANDADATRAAHGAIDAALDAVIKREAAEKKAAATRAAEQAEVGKVGGSQTDSTPGREMLTKLDRLAEILRKNGLEALRPEQRLAELIAERKSYNAVFGPHSIDDEIKNAERNGQIAELARGRKDVRFGADSLANIGGFVGNAAAFNPAIDIARQQLGKLTQIETHTNPSGKQTSFFAAH